jgi:5-formyltetrahydrofolate cyclo-ligase
MSVTSEKQALRAEVLAARARLTPAQLLAFADAVVSRLIALLSPLRPAVMSCYVPMGSEPGGPALPDRLAAAFPAATLLLPVLLPDLDLDWAPYDGPSSLAISPRRLYEPTTAALGPSAIAAVDAAIVPALAVDASGYRLGRGGGSYDRALARLRPEAGSVALLHPGELVARVPHEPHDRPVSYAVQP